MAVKLLYILESNIKKHKDEKSSQKTIDYYYIKIKLFFSKLEFFITFNMFILISKIIKIIFILYLVIIFIYGIKASIILLNPLLLEALVILSDILCPIVYCMEAAPPEHTSIINLELNQTYANLNILDLVDDKKDYFENNGDIPTENRIRYDYIYEFNDVDSKPMFIKPEYLALKNQFSRTSSSRVKLLISLKCEMLDNILLSRKNSTFCSNMYNQTNFSNKIHKEVFSNTLLIKSGEINTKAVNIHFCIKSHTKLSLKHKDELLKMYRATLKSDISNQFLYMEPMFDKLIEAESILDPPFSLKLKTFLELNKKILVKLKEMSCLKWKGTFSDEDLYFLDQILSKKNSENIQN